MTGEHNSGCISERYRKPYEDTDSCVPTERLGLTDGANCIPTDLSISPYYNMNTNTTHNAKF